MFGMRLGQLGTVSRAPSLAEQIAQMFARSEQGVWYDPSNLSTLFQDSAFTVPVTAVEQPVGGMLDLSGRGNHASQATTTKRPVYSRRVNLLQKTEDFTNAYWTKGGVAVSNSQPSPGGGISAMSMRQDSSTGLHAVRAVAGFTAGNYEYSVFVKKDGARFYQVANQSDVVVVNFDLDTSTYQVVGGTVVSANIALIDDGWYILKVNFITAYGGIYNAIVTSLSAPRLQSFAGDGVSGFLVYAPNVCLRADAHLPYQRVDTATDYDADPAKFPAYLRFDGVDDALQTGNIDSTGADKITVWAGIAKLSNADFALLLEHGTTGANANFSVWAPYTGSNYRGDAAQAGGYSALTPALLAPRYDVLSIIGDRASGRVTTLRVAGGVYQSALQVPPGGNYTNQSLYIGARAGAGNYFNGRLYSLIVRGAQSSLSQIEAGEAYVKQKMRLP